MSWWMSWVLILSSFRNLLMILTSASSQHTSGSKYNYPIIKILILLVIACQSSTMNETFLALKMMYVC